MNEIRAQQKTCTSQPALRNRPVVPSGDSFAHHGQSADAFPPAQECDQQSWATSGLQYTKLVSKSGYQATRTLTLQVSIPTLGGSVIATLELLYHTSQYDWPWFSHKFRVRNIIDRHSEIIEACLSRDVNWVRDVFRRNQAHPNDETDDRRPLLWVSLVRRIDLP